MLSLMAVFRDIVPGYRIRPPTDADADAVLSKEVRALRDYEHALLKAYQGYLKILLQVTRGP